MKRLGLGNEMQSPFTESENNLTQPSNGRVIQDLPTEMGDKISDVLNARHCKFASHWLKCVHCWTWALLTIR